MPRSRDPERLAQLITAATDVFILQGYRRTQVGDIADALGVAKGTIYLYVESKEALFDLVIRASGGGLPDPDALPCSTPEPGQTFRYVQHMLIRDARLPRLEESLRTPARSDTRAELEGILSELYQLLSARRVAVKLIEVNAREYPDLAAIYFKVARQTVPGLLQTYLQTRLPEDRPDGVPVPLIARGIVETVAFWAVHRHWDPAPSRTPIDEALAEKVAVRFALGALGA